MLTKASAPAENFPFCTIDPNENKSLQYLIIETWVSSVVLLYYFCVCLSLRRVPVPDSRYDWLCEHWKPPSTVPAYLSVVDIAGLVKGAHEGQVYITCTLDYLL